MQVLYSSSCCPAFGRNQKCPNCELSKGISRESKALGSQFVNKDLNGVNGAQIAICSQGFQESRRRPSVVVLVSIQKQFEVLDSRIGKRNRKGAKAFDSRFVNKHSEEVGSDRITIC